MLLLPPPRLTPWAESSRVGTARREKRRGVILLVVITLLALFAAIGIGFVYYAEAEATAARYGTQSVTQQVADVDPEILFSFFLGQAIYGTNDVFSALRGHSLARSMYGHNPANPNIYPFNGTGRLRWDPAVGPNNYTMVDYRPLPNGAVRDPEFCGVRPAFDPVTGSPVKYPGDLSSPDPNYFYVGGANVSWTYPDLDNFFLGAINANGEILAQSFMRPGLPSPYPLRPASLAPPTEPGGDVKNVDSARGVKAGGTYLINDSYWMDLNFPTLTAPDGKRYKPLFASFMTDLDSKLNVNTVGMLRAILNNKGIHASNHGYGVWEINPSKVLPKDDWVHLLVGNGPKPNQAALNQGNPVVPPSLPGRYGVDRAPGFNSKNSILTGGNPNLPPFFAIVDLDGTQKTSYAPSSKFLLPLEYDPANPKAPYGQYSPFPYFPPASYQNGSSDENINHPRMFNPWNPDYLSIDNTGASPSAGDRVFPASNMEALLRYGGTGSLGLTSDLFRLSPLNFNAMLYPQGSADRFLAEQRRWQVTTHSWSIGRPALMPWLPYGGIGTSGYKIVGNAPTTDPAQMYQYPQDPRNWPLTGEYGPDRRSFRSNAFDLRFLRMGLPDYPPPDAATGRILVANEPLFVTAQAARQALAKSLFDRLRYLTTGARPGSPLPGVTSATLQEEYNALRWLAQLAANIVDYVDSDEYSTPFHWDTRSNSAVTWVYGTELPRLLLNEAYAEVANDPIDVGNKGKGKGQGASKAYQVRFWLELHNPLYDDPGRVEVMSSVPSAVRLYVPGSYPVYKVTIADRTKPPTLDPSELNRGAPDAKTVVLEVADFSPDPAPTPQPTLAVKELSIVRPSNGAASGPYGGNVGFYVLGPTADFPTDTPPPANPPKATVRIKESGPGVTPRNAMSYPVQVTAGAVPAPSHDIYLQRLACPHLPPQPNPAVTTPPYNPYITVDIMPNVPTFDGVEVTGGMPPINMNWVATSDRKAVGRRQPCAAHPTQMVFQTPGPAYTDQPQHTFFRHNTPLSQPFDWLTHLDRPIVSPMELLNVPMVRPHELTQMFITGAKPNQRLNHVIDPTTGTLYWFNQGSRLYRLFEFLDGGHTFHGYSGVAKVTSGPGPIMINSPGHGLKTGNRITVSGVGGADTTLGIAGANGQRSITVLDRDNFSLNNVTGTGAYTVGSWVILPADRFPGKININTLWDTDLAIFEALADWQAGLSSYNAAEVQQIFARLLQSRSSFLLSQGRLDASDRPFRSLASNQTMPNDPHFPDRRGIEDTLLRSDPTNAARRLFEVTPMVKDGRDSTGGTPYPASDHPVLKYELLNKLFNNVTTRSNVFAVWVTVGFFEVTSEAPTVTFGAELGRAEGRHIRHRMFAIIDRSNMQINMPATLTRNLMQIAPNPQPQWVPVGTLSGKSPLLPPQGTTFEWKILPGTQLVVDDNLTGQPPVQEAITVLQVKPATATTAPEVFAVFTRPHAQNVRFRFAAGTGLHLGNPGPQPDYDHRRNGDVVLHYSIIE